MSGFDKATRLVVITRDGGCCVACGLTVADPETGRPYAQFSIQHRRARGMGGTTDPSSSAPTNGLLACGTGVTGCHGRMESEPDWALLKGYRVRQSDDPADVPVIVATPAGEAAYLLTGFDRLLAYANTP